MEFTRAACLYHPSEVITNFCREKSCLLPLCPSCVCSHVDFHMKRGGQVKFDNIHETFNTCTKTLAEFVEHFEEERRRANSLQSSIDRLYAKVSDIIFQAKLEVRELIDRRFEQLEQDTMDAIAQQCESSGVHSKEKMQAIEKRIDDGQKQVNSMLQDLKSERAISTVIVFNGEKKDSLDRVLKELDWEFQLNYDFDPRITINTQTFDLFSKAVNQLLELKFDSKASKQPSDRLTLPGEPLCRSTITPPSPLTPIVNKRQPPTPQQMMYFANNQNKLVISRVRSPSQTSSTYFNGSPTMIKSTSVVHHHHFSVVVPNSTGGVIANGSGVSQKSQQNEDWQNTQNTNFLNTSKRTERAFSKDNRQKKAGLVLQGHDRPGSAVKK